MKFIKGVMIGGLVTTGLVMMCNDSSCMKNKRTMMKKGKRMMKKMGIL